VKEINRTNNLMMMSKTSSEQEKEFYLEVLNNEIKKAHEKPSVGVILCKSKDSKVVQHALNRSMSPTLVAKYETKLNDKKLLERKIDEFFQLEQNRIKMD